MQELLMGFDCRNPAENPRCFCEDAELLRSDVTHVLNVHPIEWRSMFFFLHLNIYDGVVYGNSWGALVPEEFRTLKGFWDSLDSLRQHLGENPYEEHKPYWMIAISVVQTPEYLAERAQKPSWESWVWDEEPDPQWKLLGYDVESYPIEGHGFSYDFPEPFQSERRQRFGSKLNEYHLFSNADDAHNYALWHMNADPAVGSQLVFGLYLIETVD